MALMTDQSVLSNQVEDRATFQDSVAPGGTDKSPVIVQSHATPGWFMAIIGIIDNVIMLAIRLCGVAVIREGEHGTMDYLLILPLSPVQIASAKVLANGFVTLLATAFLLYAVVRGLLAVPIAGSIPLLLCGVALYLFYALAVGLFLATLVQSMPQFGLLFMLVFLPMQMPSGGNTPLESEPCILRIIMQCVAPTHFVTFAEAILFRGAGFALVFRDYLALAALWGSVLCGFNSARSAELGDGAWVKRGAAPSSADKSILVLFLQKKDCLLSRLVAVSLQASRQQARCR